MAAVRSDSAQRDLHTEKKKKKKDAVTRLVLKAETDYLDAQVAESQTCKQLLSVTNFLLGKSKSVLFLPTFQLLSSLILSVSVCTEKIKQIKQNLDNIPSPHVQTVVPNIATPLVQFSAVSEKEAHSIHKKTAHNLTHCQHHNSTKTLISFFQLSQTS